MPKYTTGAAVVMNGGQATFKLAAELGVVSVWWLAGMQGCKCVDMEACT